MISRVTTGFVYIIARLGVTGSRSTIGDSIRQMVGRVRQHTSLPAAVGFGIRSKKDVEKVWETADGAVVGSAIVEFIENHRTSPGLPEKVAAYVKNEILP
jgi:tryptophan synthase alpha chain